MTGLLKRGLTVVFLVALAAGCASTGEEKPKVPSLDSMLLDVTAQDGRSCIRQNDIDGYATVNDYVVSVSGRRKQHFLVTMLHRCTSLDSSWGVVFDGSFSEVCGGTGQVVTREERCPIKHIFAFPSREDAFATLQAAEARRAAMQQFP